MSIFTQAATLVAEAKKPLNTKNKNEVLYVQNLINVLYKSPIVQKEKGKVFKLTPDGIWGPKTEAAVKFTFGKIPSRAEMVEVENRYSLVAATAVATASAGSAAKKTTNTSSALSVFANLFNPVSVATAPIIAKQAQQIVTGEKRLSEDEILQKANENARKLVEERLNQKDNYLPNVTVTAQRRTTTATTQEAINPFIPNSSGPKNGSILLFGAAALGLILILK